MIRLLPLAFAALVTTTACANSGPELGSALGSQTADEQPADEQPGEEHARVDPLALVGNWRLTDAGQADGAIVRMGVGRIEVQRDCHLLEGTWRANWEGAFVAGIATGSPCPGEGAVLTTPVWLDDATSFDVDGLDRVLRSGDGQELARLTPTDVPPPADLPEPQSPQPPAANLPEPQSPEPQSPAPPTGEIPELQSPTPPPADLPEPAPGPDAISEDERAAWQPAEPLPPALTTPTVEQLVGKWLPADAAGFSGETAPYVDFVATGGWNGFDGCNSQGGQWLLEPDGAFLATPSTVTTLVACDGVDVNSQLSEARRAGMEGEVLVLLDAAGEPTGRFTRA